MNRSLRPAAAPAFLLLCLLLGGSTQGIWRNLILQLAGIGLILWSLFAAQRSTPTPAARMLLWLGVAWVGLCLLQLIPLPPGLWSALPGRSVVAEGFRLRGEALPWLPLSLSPATTLESLTVIAVPLGMLAAVLVLGAYRSRWCIAALVTGTSLSVLLGALQLLQGGPYLYPQSNTGAAAGLFANSNHQATLLLTTIPFLAALVGNALRSSRRADPKARISRVMIALGALAVVLMGIALNGSMAALALAVPVLLASLALALPKAGPGAKWLSLAAFLLLLGGVAGIAAFSEAGSAETSVSTRSDIYERTVPAILENFPVGTGFGSFERVYRLREDPAKVDSVFINHAHSDPLEWLLETGLAGLLLLLALLAWWLTRTVQLWRSEERELVPLAATIATAAILGHSLVDFPLRDPAIQALFALSLAFMAEPRSYEAQRSRTRSSRGPAKAAKHLTLTDDGLVSA